MTEKFDDVKPGDLITARLMNQIFDELDSLGTRLSKIESAAETGVVINRLDPSGPLRIGDILRVIGKNFVFPPVNNIVTIEGTRIKNFRADSSDTLLSFKIPKVGIIQEKGETVTLRVSNQFGSDSASFVLMPELAYPRGRIEVAYVEAPIVPVDPITEEPKIVPGDYTYTFSITAFVDIDATYELFAEIDADTPGWNALLLREDTNEERESSFINIPGDKTGEGVRKDMRVRVTVPDLPEGTSAILRFSSVETSGGNQVTPGNQEVDVVIGEPPQVPEDRIRVSLLSVNNAELIGGRVEVDRGVMGGISFVILFKAADTYDVSVRARQPVGWNIGQPNSPVVVEDPGPAGIKAAADVLVRPGDEAVDTELVVAVDSRAQDPPISVRYVQSIAVVEPE